MPYINIQQFDPSRIPDVNLPETFHENAQYIFRHLDNYIIPQMNTNLADVNLVGNAYENATISSEGAILATQKADEASTSAQNAASSEASADNSETNSSASASIATQGASIATQKAAEASTSQSIATAAEQNSSNSAAQSLFQAGLALVSAQNAAIEALRAKNRTFAFQVDQSNTEFGSILQSEIDLGNIIQTNFSPFSIENPREAVRIDLAYGTGTYDLNA